MRSEYSGAKLRSGAKILRAIISMVFHEEMEVLTVGQWVPLNMVLKDVPYKYKRGKSLRNYRRDSVRESARPIIDGRTL